MIELDAKTSEKIASAINNAQSAQKSEQVWAAVAMGMNAFSSGYNAGIGNYALANQAAMNNQYLAMSLQAEAAGGAEESARYLRANYSTLQRSAPKSLGALTGLEGLGAKYVKRTKVDIDQYLDENRLELRSFDRELEVDADSKGIQYLAKAGIDPKSCFEVIDVLHRTSGNKSTSPESTHPGEEERRIKMDKAIAELSPVIKNKYKMQQPKMSLLPYVYDKNTQVVRISPPGTVGLKAGSNQKSSSVEALLGK